MNRPRITKVALLFLALLLIVPACALLRLHPHPPFTWAAGYFLVMSLVSFISYYDDKKRAQEERWRVPESTLHLFEFIGGWPGAFIAQRWLRHKILKRSYQFSFWTIVASHEFAAFDFLFDWMTCRALFEWIQKQFS